MKPILLAATLSVVSLAAAAATPKPCNPGDPSCSEKAVSTAYVTGIVGKPAGKPLSGDALVKRTDQVAALIRCPVCQGSSIGDSPSSTAQNMKHQVHDLLAAGFTAEQVFTYFEASYGEFIRLSPKTRGFDALVWILPGVFAAFGLLLAIMYLRGRSRPAPQAPPSSRTPEEVELDPWLKRVRAMSAGEPPAGENR